MIEEKVPALFNLPPLVWVVVIVIIAAFALNMMPRPVENVPVLNTTPSTPVDITDNTPVIPTVLPVDLVDVSVSDTTPQAGDEITFTATVKSAYPEWESLFSFELWVRQFGNWQKTPCYSSPCVYTLNDASLGTVEYKVVRTAKDGAVSDEGSDYLEVSSTVQTGDTIGPKVTVSHSPENPKAGQSVSITVLVNDISSLDGVQIFHDGAVLKSCAQKVKIMMCQASISNLEVGTFEYYVIATDSMGNTTQTDPLTYSVSAS